MFVFYSLRRPSPVSVATSPATCQNQLLPVSCVSPHVLKPVVYNLTIVYFQLCNVLHRVHYNSCSFLFCITGRKHLIHIKLTSKDNIFNLLNIIVVFFVPFLFQNCITPLGAISIQKSIYSIAV